MKIKDHLKIRQKSPKRQPKLSNGEFKKIQLENVNENPT